jgi:aminoglycoside phosphotransferase (APT) family kinase protein
VTGEQAGGGLTPVVRAGNTIRRAAGPWTPAVHALLNHLAAVGFDGAPRVHGYDDDGREVLEFVEGEIRSDYDDDELEAVARLVRRLHDSTATFQPPTDARWQILVGSPDGGDAICHNDLSPANTVWGDGRPRAFIDWDLAAPGPPSWDVAHALYRFVPLYSDDDCERLGIPPRPRALRIHAFCGAYGIEATPSLFDLVERRIRALYDSARIWGKAGAPGWSDVWRATRGEQWLRALRFVEQHRHEWVSEAPR